MPWQEQTGKKTRSARRPPELKARDLERRLAMPASGTRPQAQMQPRPPRWLPPRSSFRRACWTAWPSSADKPAELHARDTGGGRAARRRARPRGRTRARPRTRAQAFNNPGFDILSLHPDGDWLCIEVKARIAGAKDFFVTHNEVLTANNAAALPPGSGRGQPGRSRLRRGPLRRSSASTASC